MSHKRALADATDSAPKRTAAPEALAERVAAIRRAIDALPTWTQDQDDTTPELMQSLTRAVARRWFEYAYVRPDASRSGTDVQRGALQDQLNNALALFCIPPVGRRDPVWTWFLTAVVGVSTAHATNGRAIRLCDRRSQRSFADTCQHLLQETCVHLH